MALAAQTNNDGSQAVTLPNVNAAEARLKVQGDPAQNIFFDLSNANFQIAFDPAAPVGRAVGSRLQTI